MLVNKIMDNKAFRLLAIIGLSLWPALFLRAADFLKGPYLIYENQPGAATVLWQTDDDAASSTIEWGLTSAYGNGPFAVTAYGERQYRYAITGVPDATPVYYRVAVDGNLQTGVFQSAPPADAASVTLYAYGDSRTGTDIQDQVLGQVLADAAVQPGRRRTMIFHSGDMTSSGDDEGCWQDEHFNRAYVHLLEAHRTFPLMAARGNHEDDGTLMHAYYPYPYEDSGAEYYAFDYGPVHVAVVDDYAACDPGDAQYIWLQNDLASTKQPWKIILMHEPAYGAGPHENNAVAQLLTETLFEPYGVDLIIAGHNHYYARFEKNGIIHLTAGGGGAPLYEPDPNTPYYVSSSMSYNYCRLDMDGVNLSVAVRDETGALVETFSKIRYPEVSRAPLLPLTIQKSGALADITFEDMGAFSYNLYVSTQPETRPFHVADSEAGALTCNIPTSSAAGGMLTSPGVDLASGITGDASLLFILVTADGGGGTEGALGFTSAGFERTADTYCAR